MAAFSPSAGIDKLTCRRGLALRDRVHNAVYFDASAHSERVLRSKDAWHSHIPITELVNLSIPISELSHEYQVVVPDAP